MGKLTNWLKLAVILIAFSFAVYVHVDMVHPVYEPVIMREIILDPGFWGYATIAVEHEDSRITTHSLSAKEYYGIMGGEEWGYARDCTGQFPVVCTVAYVRLVEE